MHEVEQESGKYHLQAERQVALLSGKQNDAASTGVSRLSRAWKSGIAGGIVLLVLAILFASVAAN